MDFDEAAQQHSAWVEWSRPQRIAEAIDHLFTDTLPAVPTDWRTHSGKALGPMPQGVDRYSNEMAGNWLSEAFRYFFPDDDALTESDNAELVNQFICYIGDYFVRHCDGRWVNDPEAKVLHEFGPAICYDWTTDIDYPVNLLFDAAETDGFICVTLEWYSRTVEYAKAHGLPHEQLELERNHGLG
ncbi:hypothetical protein ABZV91_24360 [Nocardia sp. NPDC004568]|uniref:hypothetical protein n=1 Tax=Nocardia sp. NPDC004568 TaxID=3154551 RepID=UPI0033A9EDF2